MKLAIVVAQINRYTFSVCWLTRIQLLAFISSSVRVAMWNVRVSIVSVDSSYHWTTMVLPMIPLLPVLIYWWVGNLHVGHSNTGLKSHRKWGLGLNPCKVYLNPLVTHHWQFQVDALLWLLAVLCYHLIVLFKLQCLSSYIQIQNYHLFGK